ncbi:MAG: hypothetical protein QXH02_07875 [Desulfurococcaceae archaeon]
MRSGNKGATSFETPVLFAAAFAVLTSSTLIATVVTVDPALARVITTLIFAVILPLVLEAVERLLVLLANRVTHSMRGTA